MTVVAVHRELFSLQPNIFKLREGTTLSDMAKRVTTLPDGWPRHDGDTICINGHPVPRAVWGMVKPKPMANGVQTEVTFHAPPEGDDAGKALGLVASIGLVVLSGGIASGAILGGVTGAGAAGQATIASLALSATVSTVGSLLLSALAPPPVAENTPDSPEALGRASLDGNVLQPNVSLPRVCGALKVFPPYICQPIVYYDRADEIVEGVAALGGPHLIANIRMADSSVSSIEGLEIETREGFATDSPLTLVTRYGFTDNTNQELSRHKLEEANNRNLDPEYTNANDALPKYESFATIGAPDEIQVDLSFPNGTFWNGDDIFKLRLPFRVQIRQRNSVDWINLPELHYVNASLGELRFSIKFVFQNSNEGRGTCSNHEVGWLNAFSETKGQGEPGTLGTVSPSTQPWEADAYFTGAGTKDYLANDTTGNTRVYNVDLKEHLATFYLNTSTFPKDEYEFRIRRGYTALDAQFDDDLYELSDFVRDFFRFETLGGTDLIFQSRDKILDRCFLVRSTIFYNQHPVQQGGNALIAIKGTNVALNRLSVIARGYVYNWDGSDWNILTTSNNPAVHLRDVYVGESTAVKVPSEVVDNDSLVAFRQHCINEGYEINCVMQDVSQDEAAKLCAAAGFAQTYQSEVYGVVWDRDRSGQTPVQVFTDRNTNNFSWSKGFPEKPDGYRITYRDADRDYRQRQIIYPPGASLTEQVTYIGPVTEAEVNRRAKYDLDVLDFRNVFYSWTSPALAIKCRRGSLIGVNVDFLQKHYANARIVGLEFGGEGNVTDLLLDTEIEPENGVTYGVIVAMANGTLISRQVASFDAYKVSLTSPITQTGIAYDDQAIFGELGTEMRRLIVSDMQSRDNLNWQITAVAEAPELWT